jgi:uncharacterized membrane protein YfcA
MTPSKKISDIEKRIADPSTQEELILEINEENKRNPIYKILIIALTIILLIAFGVTWLLNGATEETYLSVTAFLDTIFNKDLIGYLAVGLCAQLVDGALGMAYGVTATSFLVSIGVTTMNASASIHIAEVFTTGASGLSHLKFGNVNKKLFKNLLIPGVIGAILGAVVLCLLENGSLFSEDDVKKYIRPVTMLYTTILGIIVLRKAFAKSQIKNKITKVTPLALFGGFMDSIGGGGWGPIVTSTLISSGRAINYTIGSVNLAEFFVSFSSALTFILFVGLDPGLWQVIIGLIIGGVFASPLAALLVTRVKRKPMMIFVGCFIIFISMNTLLKMAFNIDMFKSIAKAIAGLF